MRRECDQECLFISVAAVVREYGLIGGDPFAIIRQAVEFLRYGQRLGYRQGGRSCHHQNQMLLHHIKYSSLKLTRYTFSTALVMAV